MKLNKIEKLKQELSPIKYYHNKLPFIDPLNLTDADRFYLKNFGIYNSKLHPDRFMLRLRIIGGRIDAKRLLFIIQQAKKSDARALLTARAQLELHNLTFDEVIRLHQIFEENQITSFQTLTDNFRNIVTDPLDGVGESNLFEVFSIIKEMEALFLKNPSFIGMIPRKFNTAISANRENIASFFGNDCYFALAKRDNEYGFNLYLGGKNTHLTQDMDIFVLKEDVVALYKAVILTYQKYGLRQSRTKARLCHLLDAIGKEEFIKRVYEFYKKEFLPKGELIASKLEKRRWYKLKDNTFAYCYFTRFGEIDWQEFEEIILLAQKQNLKIRFGVDQNIYLLGFKDKKTSFNQKPTGDMVVCAGDKYCIYSLFDTKKEAQKIDLKGVKIGFSGCLKGCGRHILADIGFVGIRTNLFGKVERGVRLYLGGEYTKGKKAARLIFWAVPLRKLNELLRVILNEYQRSGYDDFKDFSKNVLNYYSEQFLALWFLAKWFGYEGGLSENEEILLAKLKKEPFFKEDILKTIQWLEKELFK